MTMPFATVGSITGRVRSKSEWEDEADEADERELVAARKKRLGNKCEIQLENRRKRIAARAEQQRLDRLAACAVDVMELPAKKAGTAMALLGEADQQRGSRLTTLPGELRNMIYEYVVAGHGAIQMADFEAPALLSTCRMIRKEALGIFFSDSRFVMHGWRDHKGKQQISIPESTYGWLQNNLANLRAVRLFLNEIQLATIERRNRKLVLSIPGTTRSISKVTAQAMIKELNDGGGKGISIDKAIEILKVLMA